MFPAELRMPVRSIVHPHPFVSMKQLFLLLLLSLPLHLFANEIFILEGRFTKVPDSVGVELVFLHSSLAGQTTVVKDGKFSFSGVIDRPTEALVAIKNAGKPMETKLLYLDTGHFQLAGDSGLLHARVLSSVLNNQYEYYKKYAQENAHLSPGVMLRKFIDSNLASYFSLVALQELALDSLNNLDEIEILYQRLDTAVKKTKTANDFTAWIARAKGLQPGQLIPALVAKDIDGKQVSLENLRGKYVLLHFWASWCPGCRIESPALIGIYKKYKNKGLQVLYVSIDDQAHETAWKKAIEKDNTGMFINIRTELSALSPSFNIKAIPLNFVIDPKGKIVTSDTGTKHINSAIEKVYAVH